MTSTHTRQTIEAAARLGTATLHEAGGQIGALPSRIRAVTDSGVALAGPVLPVLCPPGDNLRLHHAILEARPGEVLVADTGGGLEFGYWGEVMSAAAVARGIAGLVIDGGVRDAGSLRAGSFPVFASNRCIRGTTKDPGLPGAVDVPLLLGGVPVRRDDLVVADADGVLILPAASAAEIVRRGELRAAAEAGYLEQLGAGGTTIDIYSLPGVDAVAPR